MTAKNPRVNVTFEKTTVALLLALAHKEHKSVSRLIRELTLEALEMREDFYLSKIAEKIDVQGVKTYGHDDAWK